MAANVKLVFLDEIGENELEVYNNVKEEITISITNEDNSYCGVISISEETAILFIEEIKSQLKNIE